MRTNRFFVSALLVASFFTFSAFAKTEGSYVGLNLLKSKTSFNEEGVFYVAGQTYANNSPKYYDKKNYGLGLSYKYAFNYNGFFAAPGITYDYYNTQASSNFPSDMGQGDLKLKIKDRYAVKSDFGYDATDKIAPYFTVGYSILSASGQNSYGADIATKGSSIEDWFYGAGLKFDFTDRVALNLEYNTQKFRAKPGLPSDLAALYTSSYKTKLETLKVGVSYKF